MMMNTPYFPYDCYVLVRSRAPHLVTQLLARFAPAAILAQVEAFPIPHLGKTIQHTFTNLADLLQYLNDTPTEPYALYWSCQASASPVRGVSVHYTTDGALILGVFTEEQHAPTLLDQLHHEFDAPLGYATFESPPPDTTAEFVAMIKNYRLHTKEGHTMLVQYLFEQNNGISITISNSILRLSQDREAQILVHSRWKSCNLSSSSLSRSSRHLKRRGDKTAADIYRINRSSGPTGLLPAFEI